ncbi:MAG: CAP domain-containing protein [Polyangiaceae bacterium]
MQNNRLWAASIAFAVGCGSSEGGVPIGAGGPSAQGGFTQTGGVSGSQASAGSSGGLSIGGTAGSANAIGGSSAGAPVGGGVSGAPSSGGRSNSGGAGAGRGGSASSSGGGTSNAGNGGGGASATGGAGSCVKNLACKLQAAASGGDLHQDCVDRINQFRTQCACLPALTRNKDGEACADQMAEYDAGKNTAHAGYSDKICQPSGAQNECPGYSSNDQVISLCIQQMWEEGPPPSNPCEGDCFEKYGHFINMTSTSTTNVSCGFYTTAAGKVWAVQNFLR